MAEATRQFSRPGPPLLSVKLLCGFLRLIPILFVLSLQIFKERDSRSILRRAKLLHPFRQHLSVPQRPQLPEKPPSGLSHGLPTGARVEISHYIGDQDASAQCDAQVMDGLGRPIAIELGMLLEDSIYPIR
jgi:hypothetical protein